VSETKINRLISYDAQKCRVGIHSRREGSWGLLQTRAPVKIGAWFALEQRLVGKPLPPPPAAGELRVYRLSPEAPLHGMKLDISNITHEHIYPQFNYQQGTLSVLLTELRHTDRESCCSGKAKYVYSGSVRSLSRLGHRLSWLWRLVVYLNTFKQMPG
jgi:hypothetical protein